MPMEGDGLNIRHARIEDLPRQMEIYAHARAFMAEHGNPRQWGATGWPHEDVIRADIAAGKSYVCVEGDRVVGSFSYDFGDQPEPAYADITDGAWVLDAPYGVVHRIASDHSVPGVGCFCIRWAYGRAGHLRVDTHGDNSVMQGLLAKLGFARCGTIFVEEDGDPRIAYELV